MLKESEKLNKTTVRKWLCQDLNSCCSNLNTGTLPANPHPKSRPINSFLVLKIINLLLLFQIFPNLAPMELPSLCMHDLSLLCRLSSSCPESPTASWTCHALFTQLILIKHPLCAWPCSRHWGIGRRQFGQSLFFQESLLQAFVLAVPFVRNVLSDPFPVPFPPFTLVSAIFRAELRQHLLRESFWTPTPLPRLFGYFLYTPTTPRLPKLPLT